MLKLLLLLCTIFTDAKLRIFAQKTILLNETHPESCIQKSVGILALTIGLYLPELTRNKPMWMFYYEGPTKCNYVRFPKIHFWDGKYIFECEDFALKEWEIPRDICESRMILNPDEMDKMRLNIGLIMIVILYLAFTLRN